MRSSTEGIYKQSQGWDKLISSRIHQALTALGILMDSRFDHHKPGFELNRVYKEADS